VSRVVLKAGADGRAAIQVQAKGSNFALPSLPLVIAPAPASAVIINEECEPCGGRGIQHAHRQHGERVEMARQ